MRIKNKKLRKRLKKIFAEEWELDKIARTYAIRAEKLRKRGWALIRKETGVTGNRQYQPATGRIK